MRTLILGSLVASLACAVAQSLQEGPDGRSRTPISILEVRKVNRPSTPYGQEHNVKIVLLPHQPLTSLSRWTLTIARNGAEQSVYNVQAQDPYQTEVEFEADLTNAHSVYIEGKSSTLTLASVYTLLDKSFLSSRVARVGTEFSESESSLRVWPGAMEQVLVGEKRCQKVGMPCYYLSTSLPRSVPRCVTNYDRVEQCDDFITEFQEFPQSPELTITGTGLLTMQATLEAKPAKVEVVAFDPKNTSRIFSPDNYECQQEVKQETMQCQQQLADTGNLQEFMVLLVFLNEEGFVVGSTMESYKPDSGASSRSSTGVIVGSVVGGVFGLTLLVGAAVFIIKKKKVSFTKSFTKRPKQEVPTRTGRYDAVSIHDRSAGLVDV